MQIATGVVLVMHYTPHVSLAFASVEHIMRDVNGGWALRYVHANGASLFFVAVYCHIFRGIYYGSYKAPREITWIIGMLIYLLMMATAFMGYVLPWGQMSFWGATVITGLFSAHPAHRPRHPDLAPRRAGGRQPDAQPLLLAALSPAVRDRRAGRSCTSGPSTPPATTTRPGSRCARTSREEAEADTLPFWPYFVIKDLFALVFILTIFAAIVGFMPNFLGHPDNYIEADPLKTPAHIVPEWYFLPFYAMLRAITFDILWINSKLAGVLAMFGSIAVLLLLPWLDTSRVRSGRYRPMFKIWFWLLVVDFVVLMWCGSQPAEQPFVIISQLATLYWFVFFLVILPLLGVIEKPLPPPDDDRGRLPRALRHRRGRRWRARRSASRPNEPGREHGHAEDHDPRRPSRRARPRRRRRRSPQEQAARRRPRHRLPLLLRGAVRPLRPVAAAARAAGLHRGLLGLPRPEVRRLPRARRARRPVDDRGADARLRRDARGRRTRPPARPARRRPSDHFPRSPLENAPDLSLMAKARAGFHGPVGPRLINQFLRGIGGPEYIASLLHRLHRRGAGGGRRGRSTRTRSSRAAGSRWRRRSATDQVTYADGTEATVEQMSQDVAAFLMWTAEPKMMARKSAGLTAVLFLAVLTVLL